jgi:hypothetical protein
MSRRAIFRNLGRYLIHGTAGIVFLATTGCGEEPIRGRSDQTCSDVIAEFPNPNVQLYRESFYKVEAKDTTEFKRCRCDPWLLNPKYYSPGTHLYLAVGDSTNRPAGKIKLMPENFDKGESDEFDFRIPYTSDRYMASFYKDSTHGQELGLLKLSMVNRDEAYLQRASLDEYIWLFKFQPLKQVFFYKITAASIEMVNGKPSTHYINREQVFFVNGTIRMRNPKLDRTLIFEMVGDTFSLTQTLRDIQPIKADIS